MADRPQTDESDEIPLALLQHRKQRREAALSALERAYPTNHEQLWDHSATELCRYLESEGVGRDISSDYFQHLLDEHVWKLAHEKIEPLNEPFPFAFIGSKRNANYTCWQYVEYLNRIRRDEMKNTISSIVKGAVTNLESTITEALVQAMPVTTLQQQAMEKKEQQHHVQREKWATDRLDLEQQHDRERETMAADRRRLEECLASYEGLEERLRAIEEGNARLEEEKARLMEEEAKLVEENKKLSRESRRLKQEVNELSAAGDMLARLSEKRRSSRHDE